MKITDFKYFIEYLKAIKKVENVDYLGELIGYSGGYISRILTTNENVPSGMLKKLRAEFTKEYESYEAFIAETKSDKPDDYLVREFYNYLLSCNKIKNKTDLANKLGYSRQHITDILNQTKEPTPTFLMSMKVNFRKEYVNFINIINSASDKEVYNTEVNDLIPYYDDVTTLGGTKGHVFNHAHKPSMYINPGTLFPTATAAIRHFGESMIEYPSGSILIIKEMKDFKSIIWGENYVIEYGDDYNLVTKRLQKVDNEIYGYSTNKAAHPDGTLIYQPILLENIHKIWRVLGFISLNNPFLTIK